MTIIIDDAGYGDLLFGVVIGAYRSETDVFTYDVISVKYFQPPLYQQKEYLNEASAIVEKLLRRLDPADDEKVVLCRGSIFDAAAKNLAEKLGGDRIARAKVVGEAQRLTEQAYLDELRNLGYNPLQERDERRAKSFFHMLRWLREHPEMMKWAKTGWPRLKRYRLPNRGKT